MPAKHILTIAICILFIFVASLATAQAPDAGRLLKDLPDAPTLPPSPPAEIISQPAFVPTKLADGISVDVNKFKLIGVTVFSPEKVGSLLKDFEGKELDYNQINEAAEIITRYYRNNGYMVARAYLPHQEIIDGIVTIEVMEGIFAGATISNQSDVKDKRLQNLLDNTIPKGTPLKNANVERAILLVSDFANGQAHGVLAPGSEPGTTTLKVEAASGKRFTGNIYADNYGNRYSGEFRLGGGGSIFNPFGMGDQLNFNGSLSEEELRQGQAQYSIPVGPYGSKLGVFYSSMDYELGEDFDYLDANGRATTRGLSFEHPIVRSLKADLRLMVNFENKHLTDSVDTTNTTINKQTKVKRLTLTGEIQDSYFGGGLTKTSITYSSGDLDIQTAATRLNDAATAGTNGAFSKWNLKFSRLQFITDDLSLLLDCRLQEANHNLDSSEDFSLGGPNGVRAYPQGEAVGDEGWLSTLELRWRVAQKQPGNTVVSLFHDRGRIKINDRPWTNNTNFERRNGTGIGLDWSFENSWRVRGTAAWRGDNSPSSAPDRSPRIYFQVIRFF